MRISRYLPLAVLLAGAADLRSESSSPVEEMRIFRAVETVSMRGSAAEANCGQAPFAAGSYQEFDLVTVQTGFSDGLLTLPEIEKIGSLIACSGVPNAAGHLPFYSEGHFSNHGP